MNNQAASLLETLYREVGPDLLAYFLRRHGGLHAAEDLLQDTFAQAARRLGRLATAVSPRAYLFGIARNLSAESFRQIRPADELNGNDSPDTVPEEDSRLDVMREAISRLSEPQREVVELRLRHELSYDEIAEALDIPVGTVRSRLHQAVQRLRESLVENSPGAATASRSGVRSDKPSENSWS